MYIKCNIKSVEVGDDPVAISSSADITEITSGTSYSIKYGYADGTCKLSFIDISDEDRDAMLNHDGVIEITAEDYNT